MTIRWSSAAIALLWATAMGWLFAAKMAPRLRRGDPPPLRSVVDENLPPVGWTIHFGERPIGASVTWVEPAADRGRRVHSRLRFEEFPLQQVLPPWLKALGVGRHLTGPVSFGLRSRFDVGEDERLLRFTSAIRLAGYRDLIRVEGTALGERIELRVVAEETEYESSIAAPKNLSLNDELSPATELPGLRLGQSWTQPVYSPLHPPARPVEVLLAEVEREDVILWNGRAQDVLLVEYVRESSNSLLWGRRPVARLWVAPDGRVLQHEASLFGALLRFTRATDAEAERLLDRLAGEAGGELSDGEILQRN